MLRVIAIASFILVAGCHRQADPPGAPPTGLSVAPGEGQLVVTWDQLPGLTYWIFFRPGSDVAPAAPGVPAIFDAQSPRIVSGLANATQYAFVMNATNQDSRAGPSSVVAVQTTRLAGNEWTSGIALGPPAPPNLNGVAFGVVPVAGFSTARLVAVGDAGSIFSGNYDYTNPNPPGVTAWTQATSASIPSGFASKLSAVIYTGQFVALGNDGFILTSSDSNTWTYPSAATTPPIPANGATMNGLTLGLSAGALVYVAVGSGGSIFTNFTRTDNLITWTPVTPPPTSNDLFSVSYFAIPGIFVATGANGTLLTSTDAINWIPPAAPPTTSQALRGAAFGLGTASTSIVPTYVVVGDAGTIFYSTSPDGPWTQTSPPVSQDLLDVVFSARSLPAIVSGTRFVAVGRGGTVAYSDDGAKWQVPLVSPPKDPADLTAVARTPASYMAVGASGANAFSK